MPILVTCVICGTNQMRIPSAVRESNYCSQKCWHSRPPRPILIEEDGLTARIQLANRRGHIIAHAVIDVIDVDLVLDSHWFLNNHGYAAASYMVNDVRYYELLHRRVLGLIAGDGLEGDHISRDRLDCRRINLRVLTSSRSPNRQNCSSAKNSTSRHRGVSWDIKSQKWRAKVTSSGKQHHLGFYVDEEDAARTAREARARLLPYSID